MNRALSYAWYQSFAVLCDTIGPDARCLRVADTEKRIIADLSGYRLEWLEKSGHEMWAIAEDGDRICVARVSNPTVLVSEEFLSWTPIREYLAAVGG
jgi:hypothetical protein